MNLIAEFRDLNGNDILPDEPAPTHVVIDGTHMSLYDDVGNVVARADLVLVHNKPIWQVMRGRTRKYKKLGDAVEVRFSV